MWKFHSSKHWQKWSDGDAARREKLINIENDYLSNFKLNLVSTTKKAVLMVYTLTPYGVRLHTLMVKKGNLLRGNHFTLSDTLLGE